MFGKHGAALDQSGTEKWLIELHTQFTLCFFCLFFFISMNLVWDPGSQSCLPCLAINEDTSLWNPTLAALSSYSWDTYLSPVTF